MTFESAIARGKVSSDEATAIFDALASVPTAMMIGTWAGAEFPSGHPMDGMLAATGWYGKHFADEERVHPLLYHTGTGGVFAADPRKVMGGLAGKASEQRAALETRDFRARLRRVEHRGVVTAAMIYDQLPINDLFRKVDDDTVLGVMDMRGMAQPYYFVLRRATGVTIG